MSSPRIFRTPLAARLFSAFGFAVCTGLVALLGGFALYALVHGRYGIAALLAVSAVFQVMLAQYVGRDLRGKWGLRVELGAEGLALQLPANRSLIHRPAAFRGDIRYADIAAIETRMEGYRSLGMGMLQRAYVLRRTNGESIFLFEDRAIGSGMQWLSAGRIVAAIVERSGVAVRDLGMVEGRGSVLGAWGASTVDWQTPDLDDARQDLLWRAGRITGYIATMGAFVVLVLSLISLLRS